MASRSLSRLLTFVRTWLDEYSEDFRDPPLHAPLRLLLGHLRISSAVHDTSRSQPTFCSLAAQAEELLQAFLKGSLAIFDLTAEPVSCVLEVHNDIMTSVCKVLTLAGCDPPSKP